MQTDNTVTWEVDGRSGDEYSRRAPLIIISPNILSYQDALKVMHSAAGKGNQMAMDRATADYTPASTNTDTIKTIINAILGATLSCYSHCSVITVTYDSEDDVIDTYAPADSFRIGYRETRKDKVEELLSWTRCVGRFETDGAFHIRKLVNAQATTWAAATAYLVNDTVKPTTDNGHIYKCARAGTSETEPTWTTTEGETVEESEETLRPNAAGDECNITAEVGAACPNHYQNIDEVTADDNTTYIYESTENDLYYRDLYNLPARSETAPISLVTVYARCRIYASGGTRASLKIACKTGGTVYEGDAETLTASYANYSKEWALNPKTGVAWTTADINALQIGVALRNAIAAPNVIASLCTQIWVVVKSVAWTLVYDYSYNDLTTGTYHIFWSDSHRKRIVLPNKVTVESDPSHSPAYTGTATDSESNTLLDVRDAKRMRLPSTAIALKVANAWLTNLQRDAERGSAFVPYNVGQEMFDLVRLVDTRSGASMVGNVGYLHIQVSISPSKLGSRGRLIAGRSRYDMSLRLGSPSVGVPMGISPPVDTSLLQQQETIDAGAINKNFQSLWDNILATNQIIEVLAGKLDDTRNYGAINFDVTPDGEFYGKVLNTHLSSGGIKISSVTTFDSNNWNPSKKRQVYLAQPTTPYYVGDLWVESGIFKKCTTERLTGVYTAADWTNVTLDEIIDGATYARVNATELSAGVINLYSGTIKTGKWYIKSGVVLDADAGISLYGGQVALRTYPTYNDYVAGTNLQCYVGTDGKIYGGGGNVIIDASGISFVGQGYARWFSGLTFVGYIEAPSTTQLKIATYANTVDMLFHSLKDLLLRSDYGISIRAGGTNPTTPTDDDYRIEADDAIFLSGLNDVFIGNLNTGASYGVWLQTLATGRLSFFGVAPVLRQSHISNPSGGAVQDAEARAAIVWILTSLENYGLLATV